MSYDYSTYCAYMAQMLSTTTSDPYFVSILPLAIDYAEQDIYRDLDLLNTRQRDSSTSCTAGNRLVTFTNTLVVLETLSVITPAGSQPSAGTRNILTPTTHDWIDSVYPNDGPAEYQDTPQYFAMLDQQSALVGPSPDQNYVLEVVGTYRPVPLSASQTTTPLTVLLPDLFAAASMVFLSAYQKNFGAHADDPKMAQSWLAERNRLMASAKSEEFRKRFMSTSWTSMIPSTQLAQTPPGLQGQRG